MPIQKIAASRIVDDLITRSWSIVPSNASADIRRQAALAWKRFFQGYEKFHKLDLPNPLEGYFPLNSEKPVGADKPDPKEFYHIYDPSLLPERLRSATIPLFEICLYITRSVLQEICEETRTCCEIQLPQIGQHLIRVVHYPTNYGNMLAAAHTDITLLTLSLFVDAPGLHIVEPTGKHVAVPLHQTSIVIFAGDMLEHATCGKIKAAKHYVTSFGQERNSLLFFANPPNDTRLTGNLTAGAALQARLREMGIDAF